MHRWHLAASLATLALLAGCAADDDPSAAQQRSMVIAEVQDVPVTVHREPGCSCCGGWQQQVDGIALAGMPAGSPGMPGE